MDLEAAVGELLGLDGDGELPATQPVASTQPAYEAAAVPGTMQLDSPAPTTVGEDQADLLDVEPTQDVADSASPANGAAPTSAAELAEGPAAAVPPAPTSWGVVTAPAPAPTGPAATSAHHQHPPTTSPAPLLPHACAAAAASMPAAAARHGPFCWPLDVPQLAADCPPPTTNEATHINLLKGVGASHLCFGWASARNSAPLH